LKERTINNLAQKFFNGLRNVRLIGIVKRALRTNVSPKELAALVYILCGLLLANVFGTILVHPLRIGHDQGLHFEMSRLLLQGRIPYVDMLDSNPPLIYYLDTIPALLSRYCHIPPPQAFSFFVWFLAVVSLVASGHILLRAKHRHHFVYLAPLLVALTSLTYLLRIDFGQREHLFVLLYAPFLFLRWFRHQGENFSRTESIFIGIIGGIGICLKHYFVAVAAAVEIFWLIQDRRYKLLLTPEVIAAGSVAVVYALHFLFVPAAMRDAYFSFIVPLYSYGYIFWDATDIFILNCYGVEELRVTLALLLLAQLMPRRSTLIPPIVVLTLSALCIFDYQGKGWTYQSIPLRFGMYVLLALAVSFTLSFLSKKIGASRTLLLGFVLTFGCTVPVFSYGKELYTILQDKRLDLAEVGYKGSCSDADLGPYAKTILQYTKLSDTVLFIGNGVFPAFPALLQTGRAPASRHLNAIILSLFEAIEQQPISKEQTRLMAFEQKVIDQYSEDIDKNKPELILIQQQPVERYLEPYNFRQNAMRDYELLKTVEDFNVYRRIKENPDESQDAR
jgi:hypothetical protein